MEEGGKVRGGEQDRGEGEDRKREGNREEEARERNGDREETRE